MTILEGTIRLQAPEGDPDYIDDIIEILGQKLEQLGYSFVPGGWELLGVAVEEGSSGMGLQRPTVSPRIQRSQYGDPGDPYGDPYGNPLTDEQHQQGFRRADAEGDAWGMIGARARAHGDTARLREVERYHAQARGAQKAHAWAKTGEVWPEEHHGRAAQQAFEVEFGSPYHGLSAAYENPPQALPAPNPVKHDGKWHKQDGPFPWKGGYQMIPPGSPLYAVAVPYSPRSKDQRKAYLSRSMAARYEWAVGQAVPSGTKWIVYFGQMVSATHRGPHIDPSAHRTLAAAKRSAQAALSTRSNPWTQAASGPLASSFSPPPDPFQGHQIGSGPIASSYSPPVDPFGRPAFISGTLQGPTAIRAVPGYPLYPGG